MFRCLAADPKDRYPAARELLADLEKWSPGVMPVGTSASMLREASKDSLPGAERRNLRAEARETLAEAIRLAREPAKLWPAADLLEEAISKDPSLRDRYESQLQLWRKGITPVSTADLKRLTDSAEEKPPASDSSRPRNQRVEEQ